MRSHQSTRELLNFQPRSYHNRGAIIFVACRDTSPSGRTGREPDLWSINSPLGLLIVITKTGPDIDDADPVVQNRTLLALVIVHALAVGRFRHLLIVLAQDESVRVWGGGGLVAEDLADDTVDVVTRRLRVLLRRGQRRYQGRADQGQRGNQSPHDRTLRTLWVYLSETDTRSVIYLRNDVAKCSDERFTISRKKFSVNAEEVFSFFETIYSDDAIEELMFRSAAVVWRESADQRK